MICYLMRLEKNLWRCNNSNAAPRAAFKRFDNSMVKVIPKQIIKWLKIGHSGLW